MSPVFKNAVLICAGLWLTGFTQSLPAFEPDERAEMAACCIDGAHYTVAKPQHWNGKLLLVAHGHRPQGAALDGSLDTDRPVYAGLLSEGWMIATTSYRRNGLIIADAMADLEGLHKHITRTFGEPETTLIMGDSMGGAIGTLIAESQQPYYDGILAVGAALDIPGAADPVVLNHEPNIPVLFLTNQSELEGPRQYTLRAADTAVPPVLWQVSRDGHVNVNDAERRAALLALDQWVAGGQVAGEKDGTISGSFQQSSADFSAGGAYANITSISAVYGNIFTGFVARDLQQLGIEHGETFNLTLGKETVRILWGINYGDVKQGDWVAFISAEGNLMIARNSQNACTTLMCSVGDRLFLFP